MAEDGGDQRDFFISRAGENAAIAIQIAEVLRAAGYTTFIQDQDFGNTNFMAKMADGFAMVDRGARVIAVLSPHYLKKEYCLAEAQYPLTGDPHNRQERLIVLRVSDCAPTGFLRGIPYVNLVPLLLDAEGFTRAVRSAVAPRGQAEVARVPGAQILHPEIRGVPGFTGREAELEAVEAALWSKGGKAALTNTAALPNINATSAAVKGLGGVGKSVLAQEYAWRNRGRYHGVWWIRAEKSETLLDDLIELGARFIPGIKEVPDRAQAAHAALDYIAQMKAEQPWLLVYDNVEQPGGIEKLTPVEGAHALITTRWSDWGKAAAPVKIGVFPPDVAARFLLDATGRTDQAGGEKLAAALGYLPLALDHAAAYCRRTGIAFDTYRELAADLIRKVPKGADYEDEKPVFATFELAIRKATEACPEAEKLMGICAFLAPDRIPLDIVTEDVMSEIERGEAVAALQEVSLVTLEPLDDGSAGVSVHRLVQEVMRGRVGERAPEAAVVATRLVADAYPAGDVGPDDVRSWPVCRRLESHAIAVLVVAPDEGEAADKTTLLLNQYALHLSARADFTAAEPLMRRALAISEKSFGPDHPMVAIRLTNLAVLLEEGFAHYEESEKLKRQALAMGERSFGPDHPTVAIRLNNLAVLLRSTNRLAEAEPLMRRALAISEKSFGPDHANVGRDLNNLAQLLQATNRLAEAEPMMRRALAIDEASFGPDHPNVGIDLNNLAQLLQATNRLAEAEPMTRRALAIDEASFGPDHPNVGIDLNNLAQLLKATNRLAEAEPLMRRAHAILEASLGPDHPKTWSARRNLVGLEAELRGETVAAAARPNRPVSTPRQEPPLEAVKRGLLRRWFGGGS